MSLTPQHQDNSATLAVDQPLKETIKAAFVEVLQERRDLLHDALEEALEDIALARAIEQGEREELVGRDEVFAVLRGGA